MRRRKVDGFVFPAEKYFWRRFPISFSLRLVETCRFNFLPHAISILNRKISNQIAMHCSAFLPWLLKTTLVWPSRLCVFRMCKWRVTTKLNLLLNQGSQTQIDQRATSWRTLAYQEVILRISPLAKLIEAM
jgi:hypothetical protein